MPSGFRPNRDDDPPGVRDRAPRPDDPVAPDNSGERPSLSSFPQAVQLGVGMVIAGRYRLGRVLGAGAMGVVYAAHHMLLDQPVAIKFLASGALGHPESVARFVREARATATIKNEHVVRVIDVALLEGGAPYIVMEYLEGCDLAGWLRTQRPNADVAVAVDFVLQACEGIAEAHDLGIIHRDLKPANLFAVQRAGAVQTIKVLDFGISKAEGLVEITAPPSEWIPAAIATEQRIPIGSPCYMSPEQMESARDVDVRTDIWALGVTLWELVAGKLPFDGHSLLLVYGQIKSGAHPRLVDVAPHVSPGLNAVVARCLEPDRTRRFASVRELAAALAPYGTAWQSRVAPVTLGDAGPETAPVPSTMRVTPTPWPPRTLVEKAPASTLAESTLVSGERKTSAAPPTRTSQRVRRRRVALAIQATFVLAFILAGAGIAMRAMRMQTVKARVLSTPALWASSQSVPPSVDDGRSSSAREPKAQPVDDTSGGPPPVDRSAASEPKPVHVIDAAYTGPTGERREGGPDARPAPHVLSARRAPSRAAVPIGPDSASSADVSPGGQEAGAAGGIRDSGLGGEGAGVAPSTPVPQAKPADSWAPPDVPR